MEFLVFIYAIEGIVAFSTTPLILSSVLVCYILVEIWPDMMSLKKREKVFVLICTGIFYLLAVILDEGVSEKRLVCSIAHYCYDYKEKNYVSQFIEKGKALTLLKV